MPIINNKGGVRLFLSDAISYTMRNGESRARALFHCIFGKQLSITEAQQFIKKNDSYPLSDRIGKKIKERETTSTQASSLMKTPSSTQHPSSRSTNKPHTPYHPTSHELPLFEMITTALETKNRSIEELEGLSSSEVLKKLRTMGVMTPDDLNMLDLNKIAADYGKVVDYAKSPPDQG
ncbi:hypothetical protein [Kistimonas asteriae]|uniref:hypothetical protein n=1 Tax=Kistimonas asteriae TaxID=517724 RepID=UPI001BA74059|nr:hypothetical protein [Kistimonas asteriae]